MACASAASRARASLMRATKFDFWSLVAAHSFSVAFAFAAARCSLLRAFSLRWASATLASAATFS